MSQQGCTGLTPEPSRLVALGIAPAIAKPVIPSVADPSSRVRSRVRRKHFVAGAIAPATAAA